MRIIVDTQDPAGTTRQRGMLIPVAGVLIGNFLSLTSYMLGWIDLVELLWVYWLQSVMIGTFHFARMMSLKQFCTFRVRDFNNRRTSPTPRIRRQISFFFLLHYGFFHFIYATLLLDGSPGGSWWWTWILVNACVFMIGEWAAFFRHREMDAQWKPNIGTMMGQPYLRVVPMHLTLIIGGMLGGYGVAIFLPLKVLADFGMLLLDDRLDARRMKAAASTAN